MGPGGVHSGKKAQGWGKTRSFPKLALDGPCHGVDKKEQFKAHL